MFHVEHKFENGEVFHVKHFLTGGLQVFHVEQPTHFGLPTRSDR